MRRRELLKVFMNRETWRQQGMHEAYKPIPGHCFLYYLSLWWSKDCLFHSAKNLCTHIKPCLQLPANQSIIKAQQSHTRQHLRPPNRDATDHGDMLWHPSVWETVKNFSAECWNRRQSHSLKFNSFTQSVKESWLNPQKHVKMIITGIIICWLLLVHFRKEIFNICHFIY